MQSYDQCSSYQRTEQSVKLSTCLVLQLVLIHQNYQLTFYTETKAHLNRLHNAYIMIGLYRGAKLCAAKKKRKKDISEISLNHRIITRKLPYSCSTYTQRDNGNSIGNLIFNFC